MATTLNDGVGTVTQPAVKTLRALLSSRNHIVVCPGIYDGFSARIALHEGFECLYMTGAGTSMSRLGMADLGVATLNDMVENVAMIASLDGRVPVIADADTGYGGGARFPMAIVASSDMNLIFDAGPLMVGRTTSQYIQAGVAAFHLEDQVVTKRCGHLRNKELVEEEVYLSRIKAAVSARAQSGGDIIIIARTDALESLGYDAAVARLKRAIALGADVAFLKGILSKEQGKKVCQDLAPTPVLLNMVSGGLTPEMTADEARELGFRLILLPAFALVPVYGAVTAACKELKTTGGSRSRANGRTPRKCRKCSKCVDCVRRWSSILRPGNLYAQGV